MTSRRNVCHRLGRGRKLLADRRGCVIQRLFVSAAHDAYTVTCSAPFKPRIGLIFMLVSPLGR